MSVPAHDRIGREGSGFRHILDGMNTERILIAAECVGDARWFIEPATKYARSRVVFGVPSDKIQSIQFPIARCYAELQAATLMRTHAVSVYKSVSNAGAEANMAKLLQERRVPPPRCLLRESDIAYAQLAPRRRSTRHPALRTYEVASRSRRVRLPCPPSVSHDDGVPCRRRRVTISIEPTYAPSSRQ